VKLDLPLDANLSAEYVPKEELRLEAYRRLASVTDPTQVADIRAEWEDRYGPVPPAAEALLDVACLRAVCQRVGITDVVVTRNQAFSGPAHVAKLKPLMLADSAEIRLQRLLPKAVYKEETGELQVPVTRPEEVAMALVALLDQLVPAEPLVAADA
jgi:transcription-repair coupling factor (superfamily II helicase)